jgi:hypothetical protein
MITPNMPIPSTKAQIEQMLMMGSRKSTSGITGSAARDSVNRNAPSITTDSARSDSTRVDVQPYSVAHVSARSSGTKVAISVAKPSQSSLRVDPRGFMCGNSK